MAIEQRVEGSGEPESAQAQRRPWETPVLREILIDEVTDAGKVAPSVVETTGTNGHLGPS